MVWASQQILACRIARGPLRGPLAGLYAKICWLSQMSSIVTPRRDLSWMTDMVTAKKTGSMVPKTPKKQIWKVVWPVFRFLYLVMQHIYVIVGRVCTSELFSWKLWDMLLEHVLKCHLNGHADIVGRIFLHSFPIYDPLPWAICILKICKRKLLTCLIKITKPNLDKYIRKLVKKAS